MKKKCESCQKLKKVIYIKYCNGTEEYVCKKCYEEGNIYGMKKDIDQVEFDPY